MFRTPYDSKRLRIITAHPSDEPPSVKPEFKNDCDINLLMARYRRTGILPESYRLAAARYGDFSQIPDFQTMNDKLNAARDLFAALPAKVRKEFDNDPAEFLAASQTPEGIKLLCDLGLGTHPVGDDPSLQEAPAAGGKKKKTPITDPEKGSTPTDPVGD